MLIKGQRNEAAKKIEIDFTKTVEVVQNIEHRWYNIEPKNEHDISITLKNWLNKNEAENKIDLNVNFKYFVRSYRKAVEELLNETAKQYLVKKEKQNKECELKVEELIKTSMKRTLYIKIEDLEFKLIHKPKESHLGNGILEGVGSYTDIWPIATLFTDCNPILDKNLAEKFLKFAQTPFAFTRLDLQEINPKFSRKEFDYMIETYRRYVTGIAFLYTFLEPARRLEVITENNNTLKVQPNKDVIHASSMILMLKFLRDGNLGVNLENAFSPDSNFILFNLSCI